MNLTVWSGKESTVSLSILNDPFRANHLVDVSLHWILGYSGKPMIYSKVKFQNGNTKGEQEINADSMDELIVKTKAFIESLHKEAT